LGAHSPFHHRSSYSTVTPRIWHGVRWFPVLGQEESPSARPPPRKYFVRHAFGGCSHNAFTGLLCTTNCPSFSVPSVLEMITPGILLGDPPCTPNVLALESLVRQAAIPFSPCVLGLSDLMFFPPNTPERYYEIFLPPPPKLIVFLVSSTSGPVPHDQRTGTVFF